MAKKTTKQPRGWREARRWRAWELKEKGWKQSAIAAALGVTAGAVSQWMKRATEGGPQALYSRRGRGPKSRLSAEQLARLPELLKKGAEHFGFRGEVWTQARVARVIERELGVQYHPRHMGRILKAINWSRQKPEKRASQRDEAAIERWRTEKWLAIKKKPHRKDERLCL